MTDDLRNISAAFDLITDHWQPHRPTSVNDSDDVTLWREAPRSRG